MKTSIRPWLSIPVMAAALLLIIGGCSRQVQAPSPQDPADTGLVQEDLLEFLDGYASSSLASGTDPELVILYPTQPNIFWLDEVATEIELVFAVNNWTWPEVGKSVVCYIDGEADSGATTDSTHTFDDVPLGLQKLCCSLVESGQPLSNCEATDCVLVTVTKECDFVTDPTCNEENPCVADVCLYDVDLGFRKCVYGYMDLTSCCDSKFDCSCSDGIGWQICSNDVCQDCVSDDDCDDGNPCTVGACDDGSCGFSWTTTAEGDCCTGTDSDQGVCVDDLYCTLDICTDIDPVTGVGHCSNPDAGYPDCCDAHGDCDDGDPCTANLCIDKECRVGLVDDPLCCNPANGNADCNTGYACLIGTCDPDTNQCGYVSLAYSEQEAQGLHCCDDHPDCMPGGIWEEDGDGDGDAGPNLPATLDFCQGGLCQHVLSPDWCDCMEGEGCEFPCAADSNVCTTDQCVGNTCLHTPIDGCCNDAGDCHDGDVCTSDECSDNACSYPSIAGCCNQHPDCDDGNPCNQDVCVSHSCHHGPHYDFPDCCVSDADCNDYNDCTTEYCHLEINTCVSDIVPNQDPPCCFVGSQCDDDDPTTQDLCHKNVCYNLKSAGGPCTDQDECNDGEQCTDDQCTNDGQCEFVWIQGCCTSDLACNLPPIKPDTEEFACQKGTCDLATHICEFEDIELCCDSAEDCDDGVPCTENFCIDSECRFISIPSCCTEDTECDDQNECSTDYCQMVGETGTCESVVIPDGTCCSTQEDCSDGDICTDDLCTNFTCTHKPKQCCTAETEAEVCPDANPCTCDVCIYGSCRHIPVWESIGLAGCNIPPTCCNVDGDCDSDDNPCTVDECVGNLCTYTLLDPCTLDLPFVETFDGCNNVQSDQGWLLEKGWHFVYGGDQDPTANWICTTAGALGPTKHQRFNWAPPLTDFESYLVSPGLDALGYDFVTVQYMDEFDFYDDVMPKTGIDRGLWVIEDTAEPAGPDDADTFHQVLLDADGQEDVAAGLRHSTIPAATGWLTGELFVAWSVGGESSYAMNRLDIDEVAICPGRPPVFTDPAGSSHTESVRLGATDYLQFLVADLDGDSLSVSILEGPDFVSVYSVEDIAVPYTSKALLKVTPIGSSQLGQHEVVISVSDGCLEARLTLDLWVLIDAGYVVWDPADVTWLSDFGDAIEDAIAANDRVVQRLSDISVFDNLNGITGVFITTGVQGVDYTLTDTPEADSAAIDLLVDYLADGGRVYLEGGNTWGFDTGTDLHSQYFFPVVGTAGDPGVYAGPVKGKHFCWGEDFDVTDNVVYNGSIDTLAKKVGSSAVPIMQDALGAFQVAIANQSAAFGCRTIAASLPFITLVESGGGTLNGLMAKYIDFFENGWPACENVHQCDDSEICTFDACVASTCQNTAPEECIPCEDDAPCTAAAATKACDVTAGICGDLPGVQWESEDVGQAITYDAPVSSALTVSGTGTIQDVNLQIQINHNYRGDLEISVTHAGITKSLKDPNITDNGKNFLFTYDFGLDVGLVDEFLGAGENGLWTLDISDDGIPFSGSLIGWSLFIVNDEVPDCVEDADCDDGTACTVDSCTDGYCQFTEDPCDAGTACNVFTHCDSVTGCVYAPPSCDDGNPCTVDSCDPAVGCENDAVQYCTSDACTGHADCGYDDYCHVGTGACTPIPADQIHHCWDQPGVCPEPVADLATVAVPITLTDTDHSIDGIRVKVKMTHTASGQLTITLGNGVETVTLHQLSGGSTDDVFKVYEIADAVHTPGELDDFLGFHPDGTWTLEVVDSVAGDVGTLDYWTLYVDVADLEEEGDPCDYEDECASGYCGNGFCCDGLVTGDCCAVAADCQNHDTIVYWADSSCDDALTCQGHRLEPVCTDNECVITSLADDSGCEDELAAPCTDCRPNPVCTNEEDQDDPLVRCPDSCGNDDTQCSSNCHCNGTVEDPTGICVEDSETGGSCDEESDCGSDLHCQNEVCCPDGQVCCTSWGECPDGGGAVDAGEPLYSAAACGGTPSTCQGTRQDKLCDDAQCTFEYVDDDQGCGGDVLHSDCGVYPSVYCDGTVDQSPACATSCAADADCDLNAHCTAGECVADYVAGLACEDGDGQGDAECVSDHCQNGFCCVSGDCCAVAGDCAGLGYDVDPWCATPATCQGSRKDSACASSMCASSVAIDDDSACDQIVDCAPYLYALCDGTVDQPVAACPTSCETDDDCVALAHCRLGPPLDGLMHCYYKKYDGEECDGSYECVSGNCGGPVGQEICCAAGETCCPDNDPDGCPGTFTLPATCTDPGSCQGTQSVATCASWICDSTEVDEDSACTSIHTADSVDCGCYQSPLCDGTSDQNPVCATSCVLDGECTDSCHCDGTCVADQPNGNPCDEDGDCAGGFCATGGVCCDEACDGTCRSCTTSWETTTVTIDGEHGGAGDFDPVGHLIGTGALGIKYLGTWDDDYLYISWEQPFPAQHNVYFALDVDPMPDPDSGATDEFGGITFGGDRKPEYAVKYGKQDSVWLGTEVDGAWDIEKMCTPLSCWLNFVGHPLNYVWEVRIPRTDIPLWDPDAGFALWLWTSAQNDKDIVSTWPTSMGTGQDIVVGDDDAQFMSSGSGMCKNIWPNTDPDDECAGDCMVCDGQSACTDATAGTDPEDECAAELPGSCGLTGDCGGAGGCVWWPDTTPCAVQHCSGTVEVQASFCSGASPGTCDPGGSTDCFPHICAVDACVDPCAANTHCVGGYYCNDRPLNGAATDACEAQLTDGLYCDEDSDCDSGHCVELGDVGQGAGVGVCCATSCSGLCNTCDTGACVAFGEHTDPDGDCGGCEVCDGSSACRNVDPDVDPSSDPKSFCSQGSLPILETLWDCGQTGRCDGAGACEKWHSGETCHAAQCLNCQIDQLPDTCGPTGACVDQGAGVVCAGGLGCASGVECLTSCDADSDCCSVSGAQLCHAAETCSTCDDSATCPSDGSTCCGADSCGDVKAFEADPGTYTYSTSTQGAADDFSHLGLGINSPDRVYSLTVGATAVGITLTLTGTDTGGSPVDTYLYVRRGDCAAGTVVAFNEDCGGDPTAGSCVTATLTASTTYFIIVDGQGGLSEKGDLSIDVELTTFCGNGICDAGEVCGGCVDCSPCCGDGSCDLLDGENSCTCAADCDPALASGNACNDGCCSAWDCSAGCVDDCDLCTDCTFCADPVGEIEGSTPVGGAIYDLYGWSCDPDHTGDPVTVELYDNGLTTGVTTSASELRVDDPGGASCDTSVGFSVNLTLSTEGGHVITAKAMNLDSGEPDVWLTGSVCVGICGTKVCGDDGCGGSCGTCGVACQHDGDGTYSGQSGVCTAGACGALTPCSAGYACDGPLAEADGDACAAVCASNDDDYCESGYTCEGTSCDPKLADGELCDEAADCVSGNCRKEISSGTYYCASAGKDCSDQGGSGYVSTETEGAWLCAGLDASWECAAGSLCDTWVGHYCRLDLTWELGTGVSHTCSATPSCIGDVRYLDLRCDGGAGAAGTCDAAGNFGVGCGSEIAVDADHCDSDVWTGVGVTFCCEDSGTGVGVASDPCAGKDAECIASRTCADGADGCSMVAAGTTCNTTGFCTLSAPDWCSVGKPNGDVCVEDHECASKNCDADLSDVKRCHATPTSCVKDATGAETTHGAALCVNGTQYRPCNNATWSTSVTCTGCQSCSLGACVDDDTNCTQSAWDDCGSICIKSRSNNGVCTGGVCGTESAPVGAGLVCSGGGGIDPSASGYCDVQVACTADSCSAPMVYRGCSGTGVACEATGDESAGTWNAGAGTVISETASHTAPTVAGLSCATSGAGFCSPLDHCSGDAFYDGFTCNGAGACTLDKSAIGCCEHAACAADEYCDTDNSCKTLSLCAEPSGTGLGQVPQGVGEDLRDECPAGAWDGCIGTCIKTKSSSGFCSGGGYTCGIDASYLVTEGRVCDGGAEVAPSSGINCGSAVECFTGQCSGSLFYAGCTAGGLTCSTDSGEWVYNAPWNASYGTKISEIKSALGSSCATTADLCDATPFCLGDDRYSGFICNGIGDCDAATGAIGCCAHTQCDSTEYCRESDHSCQALTTCGKRSSGDYGQVYQAASEDLRNDCPLEGCASGFCIGSDYACDPGGKLDPPDSVIGGTRNCPGSVTLQVSGSSGSFAWYDVPSGGDPLGSGPTFNTPSISSDTTFYVEAIEAYPFPSNVLVFDENCLSPWPTPYKDAMDNLAWNYTRAFDEVDFVNKLTDGTVWDLVVFDRYYYITQNYVYDHLYAYLAGGGKLIFSNWKFTSHAIFSAMDVSYHSTFYSGKTIHAWDSGHALYNEPNTISSAIAITQDTCNVDGFNSYVIGGGTAVSGFTSSPQSGRAAVVLNSEETTIYMGEMPHLFNEAALGDFLENQLMYMSTDGWVGGPGVGEICSSARIPVVAEIDTLTPPSASDVVVACGETATLEATGSTGLYEWYDVPTGGSNLGIGSTYETGAVSDPETYYIEAVESYATNADILVLDYDCVSPWLYPYSDVLTDMGLNFTQAGTEATFRAQLDAQSWDLVIYNSYTYAPASSTLNRLEDHLDAGGKLIVSTWPNSSHALYGKMNVSSTGFIWSTETIYAWDDTHDLFTTPNPIPSVLDAVWDTCSSPLGVTLQNVGGDAVAGFLPVETANVAAVVVGASGDSIFQGEVPFAFNQATLQEFLENQIAFLIGVGDGCTSTRTAVTASSTGSCVTTCTHTIKLWDSDNDGWNGGRVDVKVDGVLVLDDITLSSGSGPATFTFEAEDGAQIHVRYWRGGGSKENYYRVYDGGGTLLLDKGCGGGGCRPPKHAYATAACPSGCAHEISLHDSYGDGWNGGKVDVSVAGVLVLDDVTLASGYGPATYTFYADTGDLIQVTYYAGSWSYENSYKVYDGSGTLIFQKGNQSGSGTAACP